MLPVQRRRPMSWRRSRRRGGRLSLHHYFINLFTYSFVLFIGGVSCSAFAEHYKSLAIQPTLVMLVNDFKSIAIQPTSAGSPSTEAALTVPACSAPFLPSWPRRRKILYLYLYLDLYLYLYLNLHLDLYLKQPSLCQPALLFALLTSTAENPVQPFCFCHFFPLLPSFSLEQIFS